jgi:hypothetical protein
MRWPFWGAAALAAILATAHLAGAVPRFDGPDARILPESEIDRTLTYSNVLPEDYVGPAVCASCHPKQHGLWLAHPHSRMNQLPTPASVLGDFSGAKLRLHNAAVVFRRDGQRYLMEVVRHEQAAAGRRPEPRAALSDGQPVAEPLRTYQVTRTVGSRVEQFYIGRQIAGPEQKDDPQWRDLYGEHMLPFVWSEKLAAWLPKAYFDPDGPDELCDGRPLVEGVDRLRDLRPYAMICMNCHNTFAYAYRVFSPDLRGFPKAQVSAAPGELAELLTPHIAVQPLVKDFEGLNARLDPDRHLVTLGISCESCHFGGREHALEQQKIRFAPTSPYVRLTSLDTHAPLSGRRDDPATINGLCTQCHSGHARLYPNGAAAANSREGLDFLAGHCTSRLSCVDCHEPHTSDGLHHLPRAIRRSRRRPGPRPARRGRESLVPRLPHAAVRPGPGRIDPHAPHLAAGGRADGRRRGRQCLQPVPPRPFAALDAR